MTVYQLRVPGGASEAKQDDILEQMSLSLAELQQKFEQGQAVALDPATLAALETVNAVVSGTVTVVDSATEAKQDAIIAALGLLLTELGQKLEPGQSIALDPATLAALETVNALVSGTVEVSNLPEDQKVHDDYQSGEVLPDQNGAGAVLTFTFSSPVHMVVIHAKGADADIARCDPFGGTPSASTGVRCPSDVPTYMPVQATVVKVFAPAGMVVTVVGYRRS